MRVPTQHIKCPEPSIPEPLRRSEAVTIIWSKTKKNLIEISAAILCREERVYSLNSSKLIACLNKKSTFFRGL